MASFLSPAARYHGCGLEEVAELEDGCPFCVADCGTQHHVFWDCPFNTAPVPPPRNFLQKRFAWPILGNPNNDAVIAHVCRTIEELWLLRVACKVATPLIAWLFLLGMSSDNYREGSVTLLSLFLTSLNLGSHVALGWRGECCGSSGGSCFCASSGGSCLSTFFFPTSLTIGS